MFQYEPTYLLAEAINGELVFTSRSAMPLVRYNGERIWQRLPDGVELDDLISAGIFGLIALTSSRPSAAKTSTTPRLYSRCRSSTKASSASVAPPSSSRSPSGA